MARDQKTRLFSVVLSFESYNIMIGTDKIYECYAIEDIYSFCMTGKIVYADMTGTWEYGPLTGNELITLVYGTEERRVTKTFLIHKINKISQISDSDTTSQYMIEIIFVDTMFYKFNIETYSKSWSDTKISKIISEISEGMLLQPQTNFDEFEISNESIDFYMPYWTPSQAIRWLLKRGSGTNQNVPGYLFYNNSSKSIGENTVTSNLVTIDKLLNNTIDVDEKNYVFENAGDVYSPNKILEWEYSGLDNISKKGVQGGHVLGYDFKTKGIIDNKYKYSESISKFSILGDYTLYFDIGKNNIEQNLMGDGDSNIIDNIYLSEFIKRYSLQNVCSIVVVGNEERYAGKLIDIQWPSFLDKSVYNKSMMGLYLIKSVTHYFKGKTSEPYYQKLVLIKNGYYESDSMGLVKATKKII